MQLAARSSALSPTLTMVAILLLAAACGPRIETRGNQIDPAKLADVSIGKTTRDEVTQALGSPSSIAVFDNETWYYISKRTETLAFFAPEETEREVVIVRFDDKGRVFRIEKLGLDDGRNVDLVQRETPTAGKELTLLQQLVGNVGRFNTSTPGKKY